MTCCLFNGLAWFPVCTAITGYLTLLVPYIVSYKNNLLKVTLPFISDTGTLPPASCYFSFLCISFAFWFIMLAFVRFSHVRGLLGHNIKAIQIANVTSFLIAIVGIIGLNLVASVQQTVNIHVHVAGAILALGLTPIYCALQMYLSGKFISAGYYGKCKVLFVFRLFLCIICSVCCGGLLLFVSVEGFTYLYTPTSDERTVYYMCTSSEYIMTSAFFTFLLTLTKEFSTINVTIFVEMINGQQLTIEE